MGVKNNYLEIVNKIETSINGKIEVEKPEEGEVYILYSFDLVNSTKYKSISKYWPEVFEIFYRETGLGMTEKISGVLPWKYIGDEILFAKKITHENDIFDACKNVDLVRKAVLSNLHSAFKCTKGILEIKCVVWMTRAIKDGRKLSGEEAILLKTIDLTSSKDNITLDFLGKDIDCGFRLGKFVEHGKTIVGAKFCYCLLKFYQNLNKEKVSVKRYKELEKMLTNNFIIVSYKTLKGIWNENPYPVVWYHPELTNPKKVFKYSDHLQSEMVRCFLNDYQNNKYTQEFYKLEYMSSLMEEHNLISEMNLIEKIIIDQINQYQEEEKNKKIKKTYTDKVKPKYEVHNSIAFVGEREEVLLFRRSKNKNIQNDKWEFGSVFLKNGDDMHTSIKESYEEKYMITKEMIQELIPISQFYISKENVCGFIYKTPMNVKRMREILRDKTKDYSRYKIVAIKKVLDDVRKTPEIYVPNFERDLLILQESLRK